MRRTWHRFQTKLRNGLESRNAATNAQSGVGKDPNYEENLVKESELQHAEQQNLSALELQNIVRNQDLAPTTPYQYLPLNEEAHEIRLLTILPRIIAPEIRICLDVISFTPESDLEFEALSYAWGSAVDPVEVLVGESGSQTIKVTQNLAAALPHLQYDEEPRTIWIDALCVNQRDLSERGSQVKRMAGIYSKASEVVVWLGPESSDTALAIACCKEVSAKITVDWSRETMAPAEHSTKSHWADRATEYPWNSEQQLAVCNLLRRDWFSRLWIWQEIALAKSAVVMCGALSLPWISIQDTVFSYYVKKKTQIMRASLSEIEYGLYFLCKSHMYPNFTDLIDDMRDAKCLDPRDRLFATFSLLHPTEKNLAIKVNYTRTTSEIYLEFTQNHLTQKGTLDILGCVEMIESAFAIASWVPDWTSFTQTRPMLRHLSSGSSKSSIEFKEKEILQVMGRRISTVTNAECFHSLRDLSIYGLANELNRVTDLLNIRDSFIRGDSLESLGRSLCGGGCSERYFPPNEIYPSLRDSKYTLSIILKSEQDDCRGLNFSRESGFFLKAFSQTCEHRALFKCDESFGIGPRATKQGDIIAVLLGCSNPMVLRPKSNGRFLVVGEAYYDGFMNGEAILGQLPQDYKIGEKYDEQLGGYCFRYFNSETKELRLDDPRLNGVELPPGWKMKEYSVEDGGDRHFVNDETGEETRQDPRLDVKELRRRGVELDTFCLE